jgi:hypothetical protein
MTVQAGLSTRITSILRSNIAIRYVSLTFIILFVLYQVTNTWSPHPALVPTEQTNSLSNPHSSVETPPDVLPTTIQSRIGKVTSLYYNATSVTSQAYERALLSHQQHDQRYGYKHFVQRRGAIKGLWAKHAYLIHLLVKELNKPPAERLDWLFWHDADVVLLNSLLPLEVYLPPDGENWAHINLLVTNDLGGLNDGVFFVRVCEWSVRFFAAGLSFPYYRPEVHLRYDEQTALGFLLEARRWGKPTLHVPQRWFNAYQDFGNDYSIPEEWNWRHDYVEPGDLLVHLPGTGGSRNQIIDEWLERLRTEWSTYNMPFNKTAYSVSIKEFWDSGAETENERQDSYWRHYHILNKVGGPADDVTRDGVKELEATMRASGNSDAEIEDAVKEYEDGRKEIKKEILRDYEKAILNGTVEDNVKAD